MMAFVCLFNYLVSWDTVWCSSSWLRTSCVSEDNFEVLIPRLHLPSSEVKGVPHYNGHLVISHFPPIFKETFCSSTG